MRGCLRALGIRVRGLYVCTKGTFVTTVLSDTKVSHAWLEQQTGVNYLTLLRRYAKWMPLDRGPSSRASRRSIRTCSPMPGGGQIAPPLRPPLW
jgi:hypothetical protein